MPYTCAIVEQPGTGTSRLLQSMFDGWAGTAHVQLFPGTVYLCANTAVKFPSRHIGLAPFEHLHAANHQRNRGGYSPRLYPIALGGVLLAWAFRWSEDDVNLGFVGNLATCEAPRLLEVVAPVSIRAAFGTVQLSLEFVANTR